MQALQRAGLARRPAGVAVLLGALILVAVISKVDRPGVRGHALATWPEPPPVGSCLVFAADGAQVVSCARPHDLELTRSFAATDPAATDLRGQTADAYHLCHQATTDYIGPSADSTAVGESGQGWSLPLLSYRIDAIAAPPDQRVGELGWAACTVAPAPPASYLGTIRDAKSEHRPSAYGTCFSQQWGDFGSVSCAGPHRGEVLATAVVPATTGTVVTDHSSDPAVAALTGQCPELAAAVMETSDPTHGGVLIVTVPSQSAVSFEVGGAPTPATGDGTTTSAAHQYVQVSCVIKSIGTNLLTDSMVGWGNRPPPLR